MSDHSSHQAMHLKVLIPFAIVTLIWGSTWLVIHDQLGTVPLSWSVTYRFLVGGLTMLAYAAIRRERVVLDARGWRFVVAVALCQFCLNFNFVYAAETHITSGLVAVLFALLLVPNAVFGRIFLGQRLGRQFIAGSTVAMAGVILLFVHEARSDPHGPQAALAGIAMALLAVLSASIANVLQGTETARRYPMLPTLGIAMLVGTAMNAVLAWIVAGPPVIEMRVNYLLGVLYLGVFASALAFTLYFTVIRAVGPAKAAYSGVIVPVIAMLLSTIFEGYRWSSLALGGAVLAMVGLVIAMSARRPKR